MNFTTPEFLLFFPLVLAAYRLCPQQKRWAVLLAASYLFYMRWHPGAALLLFATTALTWWCARQIHKGNAPKRWLALGCAVPLGALALFKYADFFLSNLTAREVSLGLLLPVGISFYTFQTLSYVVDVYRGQERPEPHFGFYALFVAFFPQLVAGPIERPGRLLPQLHAAKTPRWADISAGLWPMLRGFYKKLVLADYLAIFVEPVYAAPDTAPGAAVAAATVLFALQIYCDFSGYSDIAVGAARMLGIALMQNFNAPYAAATIRDFWRRWHISLTTWLTDYLYIPLGGSRCGVLRGCANTLLVFFASGLWHGASWNFVAWGALHGLYLVAARLLPRSKWRVPRPLARLRTFALVCLAWVFFRAGSMGQAVQLLQALFTRWQPGCLGAANALLGWQPLDALRLPLTLLGLCWLNAQPRRGGLCAKALPVFYTVLAVALAWLALLGASRGGAFIYFQF